MFTPWVNFKTKFTPLRARRHLKADHILRVEVGMYEKEGCAGEVMGGGELVSE